MGLTSTDIARGRTALQEGDWETARAAFEVALKTEETAEALQGLSQAHWWLGDEDEAVSLRERAHTRFRKGQDVIGAVRSALWLSDEYRTVYGNQSAANGWLTRAQRLIEQASPGPTSGWMAVARASRAADPAIKESYAAEALSAAEQWEDTEMEAYALAQLGLARVYLGQVEAGLSDLNEAMAVATSHDDPVVTADSACALMHAAEQVGDLTPFNDWASLIERYMTQRHMPLTASCGTCCGELFAATGKWDQAEQEFLRTIRTLEKRGHRSRCSHPSARLASLRIRQGRFEEAEAILAPFQTLPESVEPMAALHIARGEHGPAIRLLQRRLSQIGDANLLSVPMLALLAQAQAARGDSNAAAHSADRLSAIADIAGLDGVQAHAALARARWLRAIEAQRALESYEAALGHFEAASMPMEAAITRLETASLLAAEAPDLAVGEARAAHSRLADLGATYLADQAAALLRELGIRGQTGPKTTGVLTKRETEVLELIAIGLTNTEIADRLYISHKTTANHVSNILTKLGARSRTEAAARLLGSQRTT